MGRINVYRKGVIIFVLGLLILPGSFPSQANETLLLKDIVSNRKATITVDDEGDGDYRTITQALNNANHGDIIEVYSGIYKETITINKMITLKGIPYELGSGNDEGPPIIDGNQKNSVISTISYGVIIDGFIITNSKHNAAGIHLSSHYNTITNNEIWNNYHGMKLYPSSGNIINNNHIHNNNGEGIWLSHSHENTITRNNISNNANGISANLSSLSNHITYNVILENLENGVEISETSFGSNITMNNISKNVIGLKTTGGSDNNLFYKNNLIENELNAFDSSKNQYFSRNEGNYWSDYTGLDEDGDGIGDTPYEIPGEGANTDNYPLIAPLCLNDPPCKPYPPQGRTTVRVNIPETYTAIIDDPNGDKVYCIFNWGDGTSTTVGPKKTGSEFSATHTWTMNGSYEIKVQGYDGHLNGDLSYPLQILVQKRRSFDIKRQFIFDTIWNFKACALFDRILEKKLSS